MGALRVDRTIPGESVVRDALAGGPPLFADGESLRHLRVVCYPAWRVTYAYGDRPRDGVALLDGTWSGQESDLAPYAPASDPAATLDPDRRYGDPMFVDANGDATRARTVFEDWMNRWRDAERTSADLRGRLGLPADFAPDAFREVVEVTQVYLPFWVLELADGSETWLVAVRGAGPLVAGEVPERHAWLARLLGEQDGFFERFHRSSTDGEDPAAGSDGEPSRGGVQPEGADLQAEQLLEPPPDRTFADVGGLADLEATLREQVLRPLGNPRRYERYGLGTTGGVLLYGPPGCGKTYVAGALAGELGRPFVPVTPTELTSKWVGKAADNVADAFAIARANQPCLVFLDEIDAVAADRGGRMTNTERQMVNQLLAELQALDGEDVVVVAATNRLEAIDDAVLRSGRFDERVEVPPPDAPAREAVLEVHLADRPTAEALSLRETVERTAGLAASDLALVVERAARRALDDDAPIGEDHLLAAAAETATSIPTWVDRYDLGGRPAAFGPADDDVRQPPGVGRDATEVVSPPPERDFASVPGMAAVKTALRERVLAPVLAPERYEAYGLADLDGALLYGPPGCGKSYLARAVAGEVGCRFVHLRPGDLFGEAGARPAEAVADLFEVARANEPCVLFVDDLDVDSGRNRVPTVRHRRLLTQLSTELRAVTRSAVLVLGAAQVVGDVADDLLHAGCFDERIEVPPPSPATREAVLRATVDEALLGAVDWDPVVERAAGYATGDLVLVAETAARAALRADGQVTTGHLLDALDRIDPSLAGWSHADRYAADDHGSDLRYIG